MSVLLCLIFQQTVGVSKMIEIRKWFSKKNIAMNQFIAGIYKHLVKHPVFNKFWLLFIILCVILIVSKTYSKTKKTIVYGLYY